MLVDQVRHAGVATSVVTSATDVTGQYVDLQARINALQVRSNSVLKIMTRNQLHRRDLSVQNQLNSIQSQIEQLQAQLNLLNSETNLRHVDRLAARSREPSRDARAPGDGHRQGVARLPPRLRHWR